MVSQKVFEEAHLPYLKFVGLLDRLHLVVPTQKERKSQETVELLQDRTVLLVRVDIALEYLQEASEKKVSLIDRFL